MSIHKKQEVSPVQHNSILGASSNSSEFILINQVFILGKFKHSPKWKKFPGDDELNPMCKVKHGYIKTIGTISDTGTLS